MTIYLFRLILILILLLTGCSTDISTSDLPTCTKTDCNCSDFATQQEAQRVLDAFPDDRYKLDRDGNGIACESLPKGTKKKTTTTPKAIAPAKIHLKYGNPSQANSKDLNNYLLEKPQYALSYNCETGIPNWVSWQLDRSWLGSVDRSNDFRPDSNLPNGCYAVRPSDYRGSGYDRGHMTPSGDRTKTQSDNSETFLMTNMIPQAPSNNREVWRELESYERDLIQEFGNKAVYIVAGGLGSISTIGHDVTIPETTWKVILILDADGNPTQTLAANMPNDESIKHTDWSDYIVTVDELEELTGYDFFEELPDDVEEELESQVYQEL